MDFFQFLDKNSSSIIPVCSTILGILLTQLFNWLIKHSEWKNQVKLRKLENSIEFEKQHLITPIREFVEAELIWLQGMYEKVLGQKEIKSYNFEGIDCMKNLTVISAKIKVYGNQELIKKFDEFALKRLSNDVIKAYDELKEAENLASEILRMFK